MRQELHACYELTGCDVMQHDSCVMPLCVYEMSTHEHVYGYTMQCTRLQTGGGIKHTALTLNLHDFAIFWARNQGMVQIFARIPPLHLKLHSFLFDLAVVVNTGHGHAANAIKCHLYTNSCAQHPRRGCNHARVCALHYSGWL